MFRLFRDTVAIQIQKPVNQTDSGLYMPENRHKEKIREGIVVEIGPGSRAKDGSIIPCEAKVGERVIFNEYEGTQHDVAGKRFLFIKDTAIWAAIDGKSQVLLREEEVHED